MGGTSRFIDAARGISRRPMVDQDEFLRPGLTAEDARICATAHPDKWRDVQFIGPGAEQAEVRRAAALGLPEPEKRPTRWTRREIIHRLRQLEVEIKNLAKVLKS